MFYLAGFVAGHSDPRMPEEAPLFTTAANRVHRKFNFLLSIQNVKQEDYSIFSLGCLDYSLQFPEAAVCNKNTLAGIEKGLGLQVGIKQLRVVPQGIDDFVWNGGWLAIEIHDSADAASRSNNSPIGFIAQVDKEVMRK